MVGTWRSTAWAWVQPGLGNHIPLQTVDGSGPPLGGALAPHLKGGEPAASVQGPEFLLAFFKSVSRVKYCNCKTVDKTCIFSACGGQPWVTLEIAGVVSFLASEFGESSGSLGLGVMPPGMVGRPRGFSLDDAGRAVQRLMASPPAGEGMWPGAWQASPAPLLPAHQPGGTPQVQRLRPLVVVFGGVTI